MALHTAPTPIEASRAVSRGRRGVSTRIALDMNDALAPVLEGVALTQDIAASVARIELACVAGSWHAVMSEANRLGLRALVARREFHRLAKEIEGPDVA